MDLFYVSTIDGIKHPLYINSASFIFLNKYFDIKNPLLFTNKTLNVLLYNNFEDMQYTYEDLMHHINLFYSLKIDKTNLEILSYFKILLKTMPELNYYKYNIKILLYEKGIDYIAKNFLDIIDLTTYFCEIPLKDCKGKTINSYSKYFKNIIYSTNYHLDKFILSKINGNSIILQNIIKNTKFNCINLDYIYNHFSDDAFRKFVFSYGKEAISLLKLDEKLLNCDNIIEIEYKGKILNSLISNEIENYKSITNLVENKENLTYNCLFLSLHDYKYINIFNIIQEYITNLKEILYHNFFELNFPRNFIFDFKTLSYLDKINFLDDVRIKEKIVYNSKSRTYFPLLLSKWNSEKEYLIFYEIFVANYEEKCIEFIEKNVTDLKDFKSKFILKMIEKNEWNILKEKYFNLFELKDDKLINFEHLIEKYEDCIDIETILKNIEIKKEEVLSLFEYLLFNKKFNLIINLINSLKYSSYNINILLNLINFSGTLYLKNKNLIDDIGKDNLSNFVYIILDIYRKVLNSLNFPIIPLMIKMDLMDEKFDFLIEKFNEINKVCYNGNTALHYAVMNQDLRLVKLLINKKPDLTIKNKEGKDVYDCLSSIIRQNKLNCENNVDIDVESLKNIQEIATLLC